MNENHVVGHTPQCNLVCVPQTAIDNSCNCKPQRWNWCKPGNICILLAEGQAPPEPEYQLVGLPYWCDQTGVCPQYYWRIF